MKWSTIEQNIGRGLPWVILLAYAAALAMLALDGLTPTFSALLDSSSPVFHLVLFAALWAVALRHSHPGTLLSLVAVGVLGGLLFPGLFGPRLGVGERLVRALTTPGWLCAFALGPAAGAVLSLTRDCARLREQPLQGQAWIPFAIRRFRDAVGVLFALAARHLLVPHAATLAAASPRTWWEAMQGDTAWPVPVAVLLALALLYVQGSVLNHLAAGGGLQDLGQRASLGLAAGGLLMTVTSPLWSAHTGGVARAANIGTWSAIWAYSPTTPAYWMLLAFTGAVMVVILSALSSVVPWRRRPAPAGSGRASAPRPHAIPPGAEPRPGAGQGAAGQPAGSGAAAGPGAQAGAKGPPRRPAPPDITRKRAYQEGMRELNQLIGLAEVKQSVRRLVADVRLTQERRRRGLKTSPLVLHMSFLGNPGTGKTEVARIIGKLLYGIGLLRTGHFVEASRSTLVGEYVGQTDRKTQDVVEAARGGVLFIDEAYELIPRGPGSNDFGYQAVTALVKAMEDAREDLVVILAGYETEMERLWNANPGLKNRIHYHIRFPDYTMDELLQILERMAAKQGYLLGPGAREAARARLEAARQEPFFANARSVRNLMQEARTRMSERLSRADLRRLTNEQLQTLLAEDFAAAGLEQEAPL